ncbi:MAG: hypothetical protein AAGD05_17195, partial [Bacteroidota bacterium]
NSFDAKVPMTADTGQLEVCIVGAFCAERSAAEAVVGGSHPDQSHQYYQRDSIKKINYWPSKGRNHL